MATVGAPNVDVTAYVTELGTGPCELRQDQVVQMRCRANDWWSIGSNAITVGLNGNLSGQPVAASSRGQASLGRVASPPPTAPDPLDCTDTP